MTFRSGQKLKARVEVYAGKKLKAQIRNRKRNKQVNLQVLPVIPDKRYFTMSEASFIMRLEAACTALLGAEFSQLCPVKRRGRRYYQYQDVLLIREIRKLLYQDGFTIEGARIQLTQNAVKIDKVVKTTLEVKKMIADLEGVLQELKTRETCRLKILTTGRGAAW